MEKPTDIDSYIAGFTESIQERLQQMRKTIQKAAPDAEETISYAMPTFKQDGILVHFAGYEHHIGFYALPTGNAAFEKELSHYKTGKGSIQFPHNELLPLALVEKMVKFRVKENAEKAALKKKK